MHAIKKGIIEPSTFAWNASLSIIPKPHVSTPLCDLSDTCIVHVAFSFTCGCNMMDSAVFQADDEGSSITLCPSLHVLSYKWCLNRELMYVQIMSVVAYATQNITRRNTRSSWIIPRPRISHIDPWILCYQTTYRQHVYMSEFHVFPFLDWL